MNIFANTVVSITFKLFDDKNALIEETRGPVTYLHGGHSGMFPKVEEALNFKQVGDSVSVSLEPDDAFGEYDPQMIRMETLADLPPDVTVGGYLVAEQDGREVIWRVTSIAEGKAVLDGNHELAGQRLRFDCTVMPLAVFGRKKWIMAWVVAMMTFPFCSSSSPWISLFISLTVSKREIAFSRRALPSGVSSIFPEDRSKRATPNSLSRHLI